MAPVAYGPISRSTLSAVMSCSYSVRARSGFDWSSLTIHSTGLPSSPPRLLSCSTYRSPTILWTCAVAESGPVSASVLPIRIGWPAGACAWALENAKAARPMPARRRRRSAWKVVMEGSPGSGFVLRRKARTPCGIARTRSIHVFPSACRRGRPRTPAVAQRRVMLAEQRRGRHVERPLAVERDRRAHGAETPDRRVLGLDKELQVLGLRVVRHLGGRVHRRVWDVVGLEAPAPLVAVALHEDRAKHLDQVLLV